MCENLQYAGFWKKKNRAWFSHLILKLLLRGFHRLAEFSANRNSYFHSFVERARNATDKHCKCSVSVWKNVSFLFYTQCAERGEKMITEASLQSSERISVMDTADPECSQAKCILQ